MTTVAITQPNFAPWIGLFEMIDAVDVFVHLDDVQYERKELVHRNRIRSRKARGWDWITVSVRHRGKLAQTLRETELDHSQPWAARVLEGVTRSLGDAPHFGHYFAELEAILTAGHANIADLNVAVIEWGCRAFGIVTPTVRASAVGGEGAKETRLIELVERLAGRHYLANNGSRAYIRPELFQARGIGFAFQDYAVPAYGGFDPSTTLPLSFLDLLMREGGARGLEVIRRGRPSARRSAPASATWAFRATLSSP